MRRIAERGRRWGAGGSRFLRFRASDRRLTAKYDAASTNTDNYRHWLNADGLAERISGKLIYIHGGKTKDRWEWLGRIGGALDIFNGWCMPEADVNVKDDSHGHSDTLNLPFFGKHVLPKLHHPVEV